MFRQLYRQNKLILAGLVIFLSLFIIVNLKWGTVATPVYSYGMFSGRMKLEDSVSTYRLLVNGEPFPLSSIHFTARDMLLETYQRFYRKDAVNKDIESTMRKVPGLSGAPASVFTSPGTEAAMLEWIKQRLSVYSGIEVREFLFIPVTIRHEEGIQVIYTSAR